MADQRIRKLATFRKRSVEKVYKVFKVKRELILPVVQKKFTDCYLSKPDNTLLINGTKPCGPVSHSFMCTVVVLLVLNTYLATSSLFSSSIPAPMMTMSMALLFSLK